jgi:agmatine deiminase
MPAEWEPQEAVWLTWPRDPLTWPDRLEAARAAYLEAMRHLTRHQRVELLVHPDLEDEARQAVARAVPDAGRVRLHPVIHQDSWIRDYGPTYVVDGEGGRRAIKWDFNAWGNKYESLLLDDGVVARLGDVQADEIVPAGFVLEGGSIEVDGQGTLLTTEQCLLNPNRNPQLDQAGIEERLARLLGIRRVLWLGDGIEGDDTDGHIDDLTRFVAPGTVVTAIAPPGHPDHEVLADNRRRLERMEDARGRPLKIMDLPVPPRIEDGEGNALPASHANFLIANGVVIVPGFGGASDRVAQAVLADCFPGREVVLLDSRDLVWGMGSIHCLSQQMPAR